MTRDASVKPSAEASAGWAQAALEADIPTIVSFHAPAPGSLEAPMPAPGPYSCTVVAPSTRSRRPVPSFCFVGTRDGHLTFTSEIPGARFGGLLWASGTNHAVFLGTPLKAGEKVPPPYGNGMEARVVGVLERTAEYRYRIRYVNPSDGVPSTIELKAAPRH